MRQPPLNSAALTVETMPENGAFMRAVSLEARILDSETEEIAVADKDRVCPRGFYSTVRTLHPQPERRCGGPPYQKSPHDADARNG
jgi:hypothetical protein